MMLKRLPYVFLLLLIGCVSQSPRVTAPPPPRPFLIHLPGIGGERRLDRRMVEGLTAGGFSGEVEIYDWTDKRPGLPALLSYARNQIEAQLIADKITEIHRRQPERPILITSHSGGTGLAVWALEKLPADVQVERVILLASALSPQYDLSLALSHVRGHMYNFWSNQDVTVLSTGTTIFGTIDGVKTPAAGFVGFTPPKTANARQYQKLQQLAYEADWAQFGNTGGHIGAMSKAFAINVLAPLVSEPVMFSASCEGR